jgi:hypothetical protein
MAVAPAGFRDIDIHTPHDHDDEPRPIWARPLPRSAHRTIFHHNAQRLLGL